MESMEETGMLKKYILAKLVNANMWGGKHTPLDFIKRGIPTHYQNTHKGRKIFERIIKELANDQWIVLAIKKTGKGSDYHVSLNPRKTKEIMQFYDACCQENQEID